MNGNDSLPTATYGEEIRAIASDIVERGKHPDNAATWAARYHLWQQIVDDLGYTTAAARLVAAAHAAQSARWDENHLFD